MLPAVERRTPTCSHNAVRRGSPIHPVRSPRRSTSAAGMQYTGSRSARPGYPRIESPVCHGVGVNGGVNGREGSSKHTCNTEMCVEHVDRISRPVCNAAPLWVLGDINTHTNKTDAG